MSMPIEKAKKVLKAYKDNNYNAKKALTEVGYSGSTASNMQHRTIDVAVNSLIKSGDHKTIYEFVGIAKGDLAKEYKKIIEQDKNYPAKLRAMEPLLKMEGIQWDEVKQVTTVPVLNVTVTSPDTAQQSPLIELPPDHVA